MNKISKEIQEQAMKVAKGTQRQNKCIETPLVKLPN